ncbi:hypothetical protein [Alteromonas sp. KUL49]|uniref:hypothetical protein n=1 Tax=Alteromonas sp. KUL49 TaxID=2480798 RepID=UPI00102F232F|nr:hypothetical protein [Alteromonas sp. KUL49]TAP40953.1 hypothetical protein EYS00_07555 [Alteromonas sp. KUL49]GEA11135.1 hypothetical protein KUL49_15100 [Alteromonas sp. KUL49]
MFEWEVETKPLTYGSGTGLVLLLRWLFKPKGYRDLVTHRLFKKNGKIYYQRDGATHWILDPSGFSHIEIQQEDGSPFNDAYHVLIHTKDKDIYSFECTLVYEELKKLEFSISEEWCNV